MLLVFVKRTKDSMVGTVMMHQTVHVLARIGLLVAVGAWPFHENQLLPRQKLTRIGMLAR
jgi:hypothetical protein